MGNICRNSKIFYGGRFVNTAEKYMKQALKEAVKAKQIGEVPIGAVIVKDEKIIARAHNLRETKMNSLKHAEIIAIDRACRKIKNFRLEECDLYVTVEPCIMCAGALAWSQIDRVVYGAADPKRGYSTVQGRIFHPKTVVESGVLQEECEALMRDFFKGLR